MAGLKHNTTFAPLHQNATLASDLAASIRQDEINEKELSETQHELSSLIRRRRKQGSDKSCCFAKKWSTMQSMLLSMVVAVIAVILVISLDLDDILNNDNNETHNDIICDKGVTFENNTDDFIFGYDEDNGPRVWPEFIPQCGCIESQSPINIDPKHILLSTPRSLCMDENNLLQWTINENYTREFNGTFEVELDLPKFTIAIDPMRYINSSATMLKNLWQPINSSLHNEYLFDTIHFHWGSSINDTSSGGSEHTFDGKHFPLEAHFIHFSSDYTSPSEALNDWPRLFKEGKDRYVLAVVAVFFDIDDNTTTNNALFADILSSNILEEETVTIHGMNLNDLLPDDIESYIYYEGSLTTPTCDPVVRWHLLKEPVLVSRNQLNQFINIGRTIAKENFRPTQNNTNAAFVCDVDFIPSN